MSRLYRHIAIVAASVLLPTLTSCDGILSGIYDDAPDDGAFVQGLHPSATEKGRYTLMLNSTSYTDWHFISLHDLSIETLPIPMTLTGEWDGYSGITYNLVEGDRYTFLSMTKTDAQPQPDRWDIAIHHFDIRTNSGAAIATDYPDIDALLDAERGKQFPGFDSADWIEDVWSTTQVIVDIKGMLSFEIGYQNTYVNPLLCQWIKMDISTPPPVYTASGKVYVVRLSDNTYAALQLLSYMSQSGTKGYLTVDIKYPLAF